jgi:hypothetical protein
MTPTGSLHDVSPTRGVEVPLRKMLRGLLGKIDFDRLCPGIKVGSIDEDVLQIFVPAGSFSADLMARHSDDFAVAGEYALGRPVRKVDVLSVG